MELVRNQSQPRQDNFTRFLAQRVSLLHPMQKDPPVANQLLLPEQSAQAALFLYHHRSGHQYTMAARDFAEIRYHLLHVKIRSNNKMSSNHGYMYPSNLKQLHIRPEVQQRMSDVLSNLPDEQIRPAINEMIKQATSEEFSNDDSFPSLSDLNTLNKVFDVLDGFKQHPQKQADIINRVRKMIDYKQKILSCAICGEVYCEQRDRQPDGVSFLMIIIENKLNLLLFETSR
jgi:hypothetical protein